MKIGDKWRGEGNLFMQSDGKLMGLHTPYHRMQSHLRRYNEWVEEENKNLPKDKQLEKLPVIKLRGLRHSCATLLNYLGVNIIDIANVLGHAQTSTIVNIYAHSFEEQTRVASDKIDEFMRENA